MEPPDGPIDPAFLARCGFSPPPPWQHVWAYRHAGYVVEYSDLTGGWWVHLPGGWHAAVPRVLAPRTRTGVGHFFGLLGLPLAAPHWCHERAGDEGNYP